MIKSKCICLLAKLLFFFNEFDDNKVNAIYIFLYIHIYINESKLKLNCLALIIHNLKMSINYQIIIKTILNLNDIILVQKKLEPK